jgi:hypothetical protein
MYLNYTFGFLTLEQTFKCRAAPDLSYETCPVSLICEAETAGTPLDWIYNTEDPNYMENWMQQMDMKCTPRVTIQWIVTI